MSQDSGRRAWALAWAAFIPIAVIRAGNLAESDTFWQVRTGIDIVAARALPSVDTYSWTAAGEPWTLNSWGFDVLVGLAHRLGGLALVAWFGAAILMLIAGLVLFLARSLGANPVVSAATLLLGSVLVVGWLSVRPQLVDYAAVLLLVLLLQATARGRRWGAAVLGVGLLMVVWVNLHAAVLLGVAIVAAYSVVLLVDPARSTPPTRGLLALAAALAGSLVNPYGLDVLTQAAHVQATSTGIVEEWARPDLTSPAQLVPLALAGLALVFAARRRDAALIAAVGVCLVGSVLVLRMQPLAVLVALAPVAALASAPRVRDYVRSRHVVLYPGMALGLVALTVVAAPSLGHIGRPDPNIFAVAVHHRIPVGCHVFNSYLLGGQLILERPDVAVSIDSRNDLYGPERVAAAQAVIDGTGDPAAALQGAGCVLVPPTSGLARQLSRDPAWREVPPDTAAALFVRRSAQAQ